MPTYGYGIGWTYHDRQKESQDWEILRNAEHIDIQNSKETWITVRGNHIKLRPGESKADAVKRFVEHKNRQSRIEHPSRVLHLPEYEYWHVVHELNTNLTVLQRKKRYLTKEIGDYTYSIINYGFDRYVIIGKEKIE